MGVVGLAPPSMNRDTFVALSLAAFGLILVSFVIMGFGRIVLPFRTARLLAAPTVTLALALILGLLGYSVLAVLGVVGFDDESE